MNGLEICEFMRCDACEGSLDCPVVHAYRRIYGDTENVEARENLDVWFPRTRQGVLIEEPKKSFREVLEDGHDTMLANYAENQKKEEAKKNRFSRKPSWAK